MKQNLSDTRSLCKRSLRRDSVFYTPYTFSAKERDLETGYSYFGARYYNAALSVWLSVYPLSDKYPSMSVFMYCAGNPLILVDPDGREPDDPPIRPTPEELHITMKESFQSLVDYINQEDFAQQNNISLPQEGLENFASIVLNQMITEDNNLVPEDRQPITGLTAEVALSFESLDNSNEPDWEKPRIKFRSSQPYPDPATTPSVFNSGVTTQSPIPSIDIGNGSRIFYIILVVAIPLI